LVNIAGEIEARLPQELLALIKEVGKISAGRSERLYLVGGVVRDLLLGRPNIDLDLVVEGDAPSLAHQLGKMMDGKVVTHPRFGTATFQQGPISLDLVTARCETYTEPGALPSVTPGTIENDLFRRDFSINAMAARLDPACFGELVDPYGGKKDLDQGILRVLHEDSFKDDPTRIWRALRYEQRLGLRLDTSTEECLRRDVLMIGKVSGDRLRHELEHILEEECPEKALYRAEQLGALQQLYPFLEGDGWLAERFEQARQISAGSRPESNLYLALLGWRLTVEQLEGLIERLRFGGEAARVLRDITGLKKALPALKARGLLPSASYAILEKHCPQAIQAAALATHSKLARRRLELYLSALRFITPSLDGNDLIRMGASPGKKLGQLLQVLKNARLDGEVTTREEEQELVHRWLNQGNS